MANIIPGPLTVQQLLVLFTASFHSERIDVLVHYLTTGTLHPETASVVTAIEIAFRAKPETTPGRANSLQICDEIITIAELLNAK